MVELVHQLLREFLKELRAERSEAERDLGRLRLEQHRVSAPKGDPDEVATGLLGFEPLGETLAQEIFNHNQHRLPFQRSRAWGGAIPLACFGWSGGTFYLY